MKPYLLISACLTGRNCKYNGGNNYKEEIEQLASLFEFVLICPEMDGGLPVPRIPSEITLNHVINKEGVNVTNEYQKGARIALNKAKDLNIKYALLKEKSPSCGVHYIYDGSFTSKLIEESGVTSKLLKENGIKVFSDNEITDLIKELNNR